MYTEQVKQTAIKYSKCPYLGIRGLKIQSKLFPEGEKSFWEKERYGRITKIQNETLFLGQMWINSGCPDIVSVPNFIGVINNTLIESIDRLCSFNQRVNSTHKMEIAQKELDSFWCIYLEYRAINEIIQCKPEIKFRDYLKCEENLKNGIIELIKNEISVSKRKNVAMACIAFALQEKGYLNKFSGDQTAYFIAAKREFSNVGLRNKFSERYGEITIHKFHSELIESFKNKLP